jgi:type II secretory pathway component PulJ
VSLLETLLAMSLSIVMLSSLFMLYYGAAKGAARDERKISMERESQMVIQRISRDLKMAGLMALQDVNGDSNDIRRDVPAMSWSDSLRQDFEYANTYQLVYTADVDNDGRTETVRYYLPAGTRTLKEQTWEWARDSLRWTAPVTRTIATNVDYVLFRYYDRDSHTIPNPQTYPAGGYTLSAGERVRVTEVEMTLVTRSETAANERTEFVYMPDGHYWYDHYRRLVQRVLIRGRNLSLGA